MRPLNDTLAAQILQASKAEFFKNGFQKASVRAIASAVGVTTGAIYRYYQNKEALFDALVFEPSEALYQDYKIYSEAYSQNPLAEQMDGLDEVSNNKARNMISYIYAHYDAFKLIACCAEGTKYANYIEKLIDVETNSGTALIHLMQTEKNACTDVDAQLVHFLASAFFNGVFEIIAHDEEENSALRHMNALRDFYTAGWYKILGIS